MHRTAALLTTCVAATLLLTSCGSSGRGGVTLNVVADEPDTRITADADTDRATIEVFSPSGIGGADVEVTSAARPNKIVMRLHLRGLEELRFAYADTVVTASISSAGDNSIRQQLQSSGTSGAPEQLLAETSPYWMKIRIVPGGAAPAAIPLQDGYIEVEAPEEWVASGQRKFSIRWVDFYR